MHHKIGPILAIAFLVVTSDGIAGPNAGGTLVLALDAGIQYTGDSYCGQATAGACLDAEVSGPADSTLVIHVLAAFPDEASPDFDLVSFGLDYSEPDVVIEDWWHCGVFGSYSETWPAPGSGVEILWNDPQTDVWTEICWLAARGNTGETLTFAPNPNALYPYFRDWSETINDPVVAVGVFGFGVEGSIPCPGFGACCLTDDTCQILSVDECSAAGGLFRYPASSCEPGACIPRTLRVPTEYATMQDALDLAYPGDSVLVAPGNYTGEGNTRLDFRGKEIVLTSESGSANTVVYDATEFVWFREGESPKAIVDGFTVYNCSRAIWCSSGTAPTIRNCEFNSNGHGVYAEYASPSVFGCYFHHNGSGWGPGLYSIGPNDIEIRDCLFEDNESFDSGGAIHMAWEGILRISNTTIRSNTAGSSGGGIYSGAAAIIDSCLITDNYALGNGGGVRVDNLTMTNTTVSGNWCQYDGGGIFFYEGLIDGCRVASNAVSYWGGGVSTTNGTLKNTLIAGNRADIGGGVSLPGGTPTIEQCTISGNLASDHGGGLRVDWDTQLFSTNTVVWDNCATVEGDETFIVPGGQLIFSCSLVDTSGTSLGGDPPGFFTCNLFEDPQFCGPVSCASAPTANGDYSVKNTSPCLPENNSCAQLIGAGPVGCPLSDAPDPSVTLPGEGQVFLSAPSPNPASVEAVCAFALPEPSWVRLRVVDVKGATVAVLANGHFEAGMHSERLQPAETRLSSGVYYLVLETRHTSASRKLVIVR